MIGCNTSGLRLPQMTACWPGEGAQSPPLPLDPIPAQQLNTNKGEFFPQPNASSQAHLVLESSLHFRLILYWNQTSIPGSFQHWNMLCRLSEEAWYSGS
jgi:hypothetical protein